MWEKGWRNSIWQNIDRDWDILIIGGGITGAGVFRKAVTAGLQTLLVDAGDFAGELLADRQNSSTGVSAI